MRKFTGTVRLSSRPRTVASDLAPEGDENGHLDDDATFCKRQPVDAAGGSDS